MFSVVFFYFSGHNQVDTDWTANTDILGKLLKYPSDVAYILDMVPYKNHMDVVDLLDCSHIPSRNLPSKLQEKWIHAG